MTRDYKLVWNPVKMFPNRGGKTRRGEEHTSPGYNNQVSLQRPRLIRRCKPWQIRTCLRLADVWSWEPPDRTLTTSCATRPCPDLSRQWRPSSIGHIWLRLARIRSDVFHFKTKIPSSSIADLTFSSLATRRNSSRGKLKFITLDQLFYSRFLTW